MNLDDLLTPSIYLAAFLFILLIIAGIWGTCENRRTGRQKLYRNERAKRAAVDLVNQATRWTISASKDTNPLPQIMHANYAVATVLALRLLGKDDEIKRMLGIEAAKLDQLTQSAMSIQDAAAKRIVAACPIMAPRK